MPIVAGDYTAGTADGEQVGLPLPIEMIPIKGNAINKIIVRHLDKRVVVVNSFGIVTLTVFQQEKEKSISEF